MNITQVNALIDANVTGDSSMKWIFAFVMWAVVLIMLTIVSEKPAETVVKSIHMGAEYAR